MQRAEIIVVVMGCSFMSMPTDKRLKTVSRGYIRRPRQPWRSWSCVHFLAIQIWLIIGQGNDDTRGQIKAFQILLSVLDTYGFNEVCFCASIEVLTWQCLHVKFLVDANNNSNKIFCNLFKCCWTAVIPLFEILGCTIVEMILNNCHFVAFSSSKRLQIVKILMWE